MTRMIRTPAAFALALAAGPLALTGPAPAASDGGAALSPPAKGLETWDTTPLYSDWRMSGILGGTVLSRDGDAVGIVHDATIGTTGLIETIVVRAARTDGALGWFEVPWTQADINPATGSVELGLDTEAVASRLEMVTDAAPEPMDWTARELLDLRVTLADGTGAVDDLMFNPAGDLTAYVVDLTQTQAMYALPWTAGTVARDDEVVTFAYPRTMVVGTTPFVYGDVTPASDG
ncbi:hypothetical protein [Roseospira navarrensis]|uniref:PRC-barrel domain-containing protein n=1 Tax=Roseospira navarrensis TaxID=140058 RepID=A0A7X1ZCJ1_9PROT|nr:hypothetical protein [Roseospira navarrensis]MQX35823.1 hypothetical protein [Roseospira navarrensis]